MSLRIALTRIPTAYKMAASRTLSSQGNTAVNRLRMALEEYRVAKYVRDLQSCKLSRMRFNHRSLTLLYYPYSITNSYAQEMPSRFKKEIVGAAKNNLTEGDVVPMEGLERVLHNIGASHKLSPTDLEIIFNELGEAGCIPAERMVKII